MEKYFSLFTCSPQLRQRILSTPSQPQQLRSPLPYPPSQLNRSLQPMSPSPAVRATPFPIVDQRGKGVLEKMVDYLIGDGPANRFAMICKQCFGHNGMALQEEYEYTSFKCAFCGTLNPARKRRPIAPRLERTPERPVMELNSSSTSEEEKNSGSDSEDDEQTEIKTEKPVPELTAEEKEQDESETKAKEEKKEE